VHQVGHAEDPLRRHVQVVEEIRVAAGRRGLRDRLCVVDVEREAYLDAAALRIEEGGGDELRSFLLEVEVVEREVERLPCTGEEVGRVLGDLERGLAAVRQCPERDVRRSRGP
jgi:hypothetical protein